MKLTLLLLASFFCCFNHGWSQKTKTIQVVDIQTGEPLPFAKVKPSSGSPLLTDIDGKAEIEIHSEFKYTISFFDYSDITISGEDLLKNRTVGLSPDLQMYDEVVILPGENKAHRIIRNAMDARKDNDPLRNNAFTYNAFSKFYITGEAKEDIIRDTVQDTTLLKTMEFLDKQYIFLSETASKRTFSPPSYDKEEVTSYKVSGLKNPLFATLVNQFQSFSFYNNSFTLGDKEYINPIAPGSLRRYMFILEDTLISGNDSTFVIFFQPKIGKNFEGLRGHLYINTNGWAVERVIAQPAEENESLRIRIVQEYAFTANKKWFPAKLSTEFSFPNFSIGGFHQLVGRSNQYISNVEFDQVRQRGFNAVQVEVAPNAVDDTLGLAHARGAKSTDKELKTYEVIDSVSKEANLERLVDAATILTTGKIPLGRFSLPIQSIYNFNQVERSRLGLGLETNSRLSQHFNVGGYFAYGFNDQAWKWGGYSNVNIYKKRQVKLTLEYTDDLIERAGVDYRNEENMLTSTAIYRDFFMNQMERERSAFASLSGFVTQNFRLHVFGAYRRLHLFEDYQFLPMNGVPSGPGFDLAETGIIVNWNIRERVMLLGDQRVSLGTKFPKINFKLAQGISGIQESVYDYLRMNLSIEQNFSIRGFGRITLHSISGLTMGDVPLTLLQMPFGTGRNWNLSVPGTFETMEPSAFFADRHSALFFRFSFLPIKSNLKFTEPTFGIHAAGGFGDMNDRLSHINNEFRVHEKGYYEVGGIIDNLIKLGSGGYGIGVFHRIGHYALPELKDNFVYKLSIRFNF
jgi:hypothetical protein